MFKFALIGAAGYIAPKHLKAIQEKQIVIDLKADIIRKNCVPLCGNATAAAQIVRLLENTSTY